MQVDNSASELKRARCDLMMPAPEAHLDQLLSLVWVLRQSVDGEGECRRLQPTTNLRHELHMPFSLLLPTHFAWLCVRTSTWQSLW